MEKENADAPYESWKSLLLYRSCSCRTAAWTKAVSFIRKFEFLKPVVKEGEENETCTNPFIIHLKRSPFLFRHKEVIKRAEPETASVHRKFTWIMEIQKKEAQPHQRIASQRNGLMETSEKEDVPLCKAGIHAHPKRPVAERSHCLEKEEEKSPFSKVVLQPLSQGNTTPAVSNLLHLSLTKPHQISLPLHHHLCLIYTLYAHPLAHLENESTTTTPLLYARMGPLNHYLLKSVKTSFFFGRECVNARPPWNQWYFIILLLYCKLLNVILNVSLMHCIQWL